VTKHALEGFCTNVTGGLSRLWCDDCREETLHRGITCIHCGSQHRAYPVRNIAMLLRAGPDTRKGRK
jgi:hypothetical protein